MDNVLIQSVCFHPDNAGMVRALGVAVAVVGVAGLIWLLRDLPGVGGRRLALAAGWLVACAAVGLLVTRSGVRLTLDLERRIVRQEARIANVPQTGSSPSRRSDT